MTAFLLLLLLPLLLAVVQRSAEGAHSKAFLGRRKEITLQKEEFMRSWAGSLHGNSSSSDGNLISAWRAPACASFYEGGVPATSPLQQGGGDELLLLPRQTLTREDFCRGGRGQAMTPPHDTQEVVVIKEYRLVYVEVRKAASSTIRGALHAAFGASYIFCGSSRHLFHGDCESFPGLKRCGSGCLKRHELKNYFFFSFVRNPVERFYSSLKQSIVQGGKPPGMRRGTRLATLTPKELRMEHVDELLTRMTDGRCSFDHHLESQALSLSSPATAGDDYFSSKSTNKTARNMMIPLDFIGRSEHLLSDFMNLLNLAEQKFHRQAEAQTARAAGAVTTAAKSTTTTTTTTSNDDGIHDDGGGNGPQEEKQRSIIFDDQIRKTLAMSLSVKANKKGGDNEFAKVDALRTSDLDRRVAQAYKQDMICFNGGAGSSSERRQRR